MSTRNVGLDAIKECCCFVSRAALPRRWGGRQPCQQRWRWRQELAPREDLGPAVDGDAKGQNPHSAARRKLEGDLLKQYPAQWSPEKDQSMATYGAIFKAKLKSSRGTVKCPDLDAAVKLNYDVENEEEEEVVQMVMRRTIGKNQYKYKEENCVCVCVCISAATPSAL